MGDVNWVYGTQGEGKRNVGGVGGPKSIPSRKVAI